MDIHPCGMVYLAIWAFMWYSKNMGSNPIATISYFIVLLEDQISWLYQLGLIPKGLGVPYVGFRDSGQAAVNSFYF
jgi:hypothetical protein